MEKRKVSMGAVIFTVTALVVIVCMFLNWIPLELNLGTIQMDDVLGNINALNLSARFSEMEETLGYWTTLLPEEYEEVKILSILVTISAGLTILAYVSSLVLRFMGKKQCVEALSWIAGIGVIITCTSFCSVVEGVADYFGLSAAGYDILHNVKHSPCGVMMISGLITICCTDFVAEGIMNLIDALISSIVRLLMFLTDWVKLIVNNIGYIISDVIGGVAGVYIGSWVNGATQSMIISVIAGLIIAGVVAYMCMKIVDALFYKKNLRTDK